MTSEAENMTDLPLFSLEPSVICCDLCSLADEVRKWENAGATALHIDVLDGAFAPSLPVGLDTFIQLSEKTALPFDVHIMSLQNEWFIEQCLKMRPARICFQLEGEPDPFSRIVQIREAGVIPGLALAPTTPLEELNPYLDKIDFVLLMRIKPGYAGHADESVQLDLDQRIRDARVLLDAGMPGRDIVIDGRVTFGDVSRLRRLGATVFVGGSRSLFSSDDYAANLAKMKKYYIEEF